GPTYSSLFPYTTLFRSRFDLSAIGGDGEIGNRGILGLARTMRHHHAIGRAMGALHRIQRLGERADLVDLDQDRIGNALGDAFLRSEEHTSELQSLRHLV